MDVKNPRMRPPPSRELSGNFDPYPSADLRRARSILIDELYSSPGGGRLMYRIREATGILPNRQGIFIDTTNYCEQSTALLSKSSKKSSTFSNSQEKGSLNGTDLKGFEQDGKAEEGTRSRANEQNTGNVALIAKRGINADGANSELLNVKKRREEKSSVDGVIEINSDTSCDGFLDSEINNDIPVSVSAFKCDYCDYISENRKIVKEHLVSKIHYSASRYECLLDRGKLSPQYVTHEKSVVNEAAFFSTVIAICSYCYCFFKDIYGCAKHCNKAHRKERIYSLAAVTKHQTVTMSKPKECLECDEYMTSKQMLKHLKKHDAEDTSYDRPQSQDIVCCICSICKCTINNILSCKNHMLGHLDTKRKTANFDVIFIREPFTEHKMLSFKYQMKTASKKKKKR